jgi:hypothetical protein
LERGRQVRARAWIALVLVAAAAAVRLAWQIGFDPETRFLSAHAPAEWLTEATLPTSRLRRLEDHELLFRKTFTLDALPAQATLRARVHRAGVVLLNEVETGLATSTADLDWKRVRERDVTALLRTGENEIVVYARASEGPPAVWLVLEGPGLLVVSDATWSTTAVGGASQPVRLATTPMSEWDARAALPDGPLEALRASLPWLAVFAVVAALALLGARALPELRVGWLLAASALAIAALVWHNRALDPVLGFDSDDHLKYVHFILTEGRLPLATDGWSMYHPPLYYAVGAALFVLLGESVASLRALNALGVMLQCAAILGSLRLLFPGEPRRWLAGFVLGAFVPMQLYLAQYVTNEVWTAAFASCAVWLCLRILLRDDRSTRAHLALGALLGLALLTKVSALLVAVVVLAVLGGRLIERDERSPQAWLTSLGAATLALVLVAGWSYARVAWHFGSPLVGNWDAASGFLWWQDPGYRTALDYLRFGDSLTRPIFSAWNGCPDALYSTLWGDGLIGGMASASDAPPWRYELMSVGYWLALVPSAAVLLGLGAALVRTAREPRAEWLLMLGVALATAFALISLSLRLPFYAQCKAFYGLSALVPFAAFGGLGLDLVATRLGRARAALWVVVGVWALCCYATYWSR